MKKINFWIVLITGILVLLGYCAKDDDDTASTDNITSNLHGVEFRFVNLIYKR